MSEQFEKSTVIENLPTGDNREEAWEDDGGSVTEEEAEFHALQPVIYPETVQGIKNTLAEKEVVAHEGTPEGMEFVGWMVDGWVSKTVLISSMARPVYAYPEHG